MRKIIIVILLSCPLLLFSQNKKRLALVIGISNYNNTLKLENPVNDARLIASSLKEVNFEVILKEDVSKKDLADAIKVFSNKLIDSNYEAGFFYYAGHGIQVENTNYLVPIDANIDQENDKYEVAEKCYSVQRLMSYFNSERLSDKVLISVLDACRNNPFIRNRSIGEGGLSKIDAVSGSLIAYSTEPGKVALDGKGKANSIYSEVLSKNLKTPNLTLEEVFKNVRTEVETQTNYKQSPREESALKGAPFYFSINKNINKIDIVEIENEFKSLIKSKSFEKAISKGNILIEIFKSRADSISASKYIDILMELSNVYHNYANDSSSREGRIYYYKLASNDLLDVMSIINKYKFNLNDDKYRFSKSLINYINFQALLSEKDRIGDYKDLLIKGNDLIQFNETHFGYNSYLTACSYFIYGWLNRDSALVEAYKYCNKAYDYFIKNGFEMKYDTNYFYLNEPIYYILKWNFITLNELIDYDISHDQKKQFLYVDYKSFFNKYNYDIEGIFNYISIYDKGKNLVFYNEITRFHNNYCLNIEDSSFKIDCIEKALKTNEISLKYSSIYSDSIFIYERIATANNNIINISGKIQNKLVEEIQNSTLMSLDIAYKNLESYSVIQTTKNYISYFLVYYKYFDLCFTRYNLLDVINRFNEYYPYLIAEYKSITNKAEWNSEIKSLFENIRESFSKVDSLEYSYRRIEAEQNLEFSTNCSSDGYGSPAYLIALEHRAVVLESSEDLEEQIQAKKTYIELIKLNKQFNKNWKPESIEGCLLGSNSREECIANLLSDVYYNYSNNLLSDENENINNSKDSSLISSFQEFVDEYEPNLKIIGKYYYSKIPSLKLMIYYFQSIDTNKTIALCDSGINIINKRLKLDSTNSANDFITKYRAEEALIWFYNYKRYLLKNKNEKEFLKTTWNFKRRIELFDEFDKWTPKLELYEDLLDYYYFNSHNYKALKELAIVAFNENSIFIKSADFLNPDNRNEWKIYVLDLLRNILSRAAENSCAPTKQDRTRCIEQCKLNISTINKLFDSTEIIENESVLNILLSTYYTIEDLSYFNEDFKTAIQYGNKRLEILNNSNNKNELNDDLISQLSGLSTYYLKDGDTSKAHNAYLQKVSKSKYSETSINKSYSYSIDTFRINSCNASFLHIKISTPINVWPCLEFDINHNSKIDSNIDKRFYIDNNNTLKKEYIVNLNRDIGGYKWPGYNETGRKNDTSKTIYFDKSKSFYSNAYYNLSNEIVSDSLQFAKLDNGEKINLWEFHIPFDDLLNKDDSTIKFLIEVVSYEPCTNTLCRVYDKNTIPTMAYFTGFKDCIEIKIK
jgi:hypothetical protein